MLITATNRTLLTARAFRLRLLGLPLKTPRLLAGGIDVRAGYGRSGPGRIAVGPAAWVERGVVLHAFGGSIRIGRDCFLGPHTVIYGHGGVDVGDACLIAMHCRIVSSNHAVPPIGTDIRSQPDELRKTKIGRDVWLGAGVTVLGGVEIGDGCIVGAGAVVCTDLPPGSIAVGVPARVTGRRASS
jgi:acetyltransferase-like isoleucine patch superfamily enzyme